MEECFQLGWWVWAQGGKQPSERTILFHGAFGFPGLQSWGRRWEESTSMWEPREESKQQCRSRTELWGTAPIMSDSLGAWKWPQRWAYDIVNIKYQRRVGFYIKDSIISWNSNGVLKKEGREGRRGKVKEYKEKENRVGRAGEEKREEE